MGPTAPIDGLQGGKAWWTSDTRQPRRDIAEMLRMRGDGSEGAVGESPRLPEVRAGHGQGCECRAKHPGTGPGTGPCGGRASTCPAQEDKQVWPMRQEAYGSAVGSSPAHRTAARPQAAAYPGRDQTEQRRQEASTYEEQDYGEQGQSKGPSTCLNSYRREEKH